MKLQRLFAAVAAVATVGALLVVGAPPAHADTFERPYGSCSTGYGTANVGVKVDTYTPGNGASVTPTVCLYESRTSGTEIRPDAAAFGYTTGAPGAIAGGGVSVCRDGTAVTGCASGGASGVVATTAPGGGTASIATAGVMPTVCPGVTNCFGVFAFATAWGPGSPDRGASVFLAVCEQYWAGLYCPVDEYEKVPLPPTPTAIAKLIAYVNELLP